MVSSEVVIGADRGLAVGDSACAWRTTLVFVAWVQVQSCRDRPGWGDSGAGRRAQPLGAVVPTPNRAVWPVSSATRDVAMHRRGYAHAALLTAEPPQRGNQRCRRQGRGSRSRTAAAVLTLRASGLASGTPLANAGAAAAMSSDVLIRLSTGTGVGLGSRERAQAARGRNAPMTAGGTQPVSVSRRIDASADELEMNTGVSAPKRKDDEPDYGR